MFVRSLVGVCVLGALFLFQNPCASAAGNNGECTGNKMTSMGAMAGWTPMRDGIQLRSCRSMFGRGSYGEAWNLSPNLTSCVALIATSSHEKWVALLAPGEVTSRQTGDPDETWSISIFAPSGPPARLFCKNDG